MSLNTDNNFLSAIQKESQKFQEYYSWLQKAMPPAFYEEVNEEYQMLIAHSLMGFNLQDYFIQIHIKRRAIILCLDSADADIRILKNYSMYGIKNYQAYISLIPPPFPSITAHLRIATIYFTEAIETIEKPFPVEDKEKLRVLAKERNPELTDQEFDKLMSGINTRFLRALPLERIILALDMFFRAKTRDNCQYEVCYDQDWRKSGSSMQIVLAWRNTPKYNFLYRIARVVNRHRLIMKKVNATYIDPYSKHSILIMALELHGSNGEPVWDVADIPDFLRELVTIKYFDDFDLIDQCLVSKGLLSGNMGNLLRAMVNFIHQSLVYINPDLYTVENIEEALCRHPELTIHLCEAFKSKFDPDNYNNEKFQDLRKKFLHDVNILDTGQEEYDIRRRNVLIQAMNFITYTLKTNFYRHNYTGYSFRLDPKYLDNIPSFDRTKRFPELPFAIFFFKGMHFFGFHIRFKDISRGGLRTIFPEQTERMIAERNNVFVECYNLAYTQQKKNKDIPEGGSKGVIFLKPFDNLVSEGGILQKELEESKIPQAEIEEKMEKYRKEQKLEYLYQAQRAFTESFITLVNSEPDGKIKAKYIVDYWKKPEYIYLGPDENMHDLMITWISEFSKKYEYKPGGAFISSKPLTGINHKEYGVTSLGVNVYVHEILNYIGINPQKDPFTVKISGGPDGDVAGNLIVNLHRFYPKTAKLLALTDVSGTIYDPQGLNLNILVEFFKEGKAIKYYPPTELSEGGFLLDKNTKKYQTALAQQTLLWKKKNGKVEEEWISGSEMNALYRNNVHKTKTDIFIPAGGRPRTLNESNYTEFLDDKGIPTSKAIVEGANLYLTPEARKALEKLGVIIVKDSSANKGGVICSSFEVLCGLTLSDEEFIKNKPELVKEILKRIELCCFNEAQLLLKTHKETGEFLTDISDKISYNINHYTYQLLDYLHSISLSDDPNDPLIKCFLKYCLPTLKNHYRENLIRNIPETHKKAIISCHIASQLVYKNGLSWSPSIVDILPLIWQDPDIVDL